MVFLFSKIANFVLFARSDLRLGLIYLIFCLGERLVLFLPLECIIYNLYVLYCTALYLAALYSKLQIC